MKKLKKITALTVSVIMLECLSNITAFAVKDTSSDYKGIPLRDLKVIDTRGYFDNIDGYTGFADNIVYKYINPDYNENMHKLAQENSIDVSPDYEFTLYLYTSSQNPDFINEIFIDFLTYDLPTDKDYSNMSVFLKSDYPELSLKKLTETDDQCKQYPDRIGKYQIVSDKNMTEEEMFDIADDIEKSLGYRFTSSWHQDISFAKIDYSGDVNCDGKVDSADVVAVSAYVGNPEINTVSTKGIINGDVHNTGDGLTASDALIIQQYLADIVAEF